MIFDKIFIFFVIKQTVIIMALCKFCISSRNATFASLFASLDDALSKN